MVSNRRDFLKCAVGAATGLLLLPRATASRSSKESPLSSSLTEQLSTERDETELQKQSPRDLHQPETEKTNAHDLSTMPKALRTVLEFTNPTLVEFLAQWRVSIRKSGRFIQSNLEDPNKDQETLIRENSSKRAEIWTAPLVLFLTCSLGREAGDLVNEFDIAQNAKQRSDVRTIGAYHVNTLIWTYVENDLRKVVRDIYINILKEHPEYKADPREISWRDFWQEVNKQKKALGISSLSFAKIARSPADIATLFHNKPFRTSVEGALFFLSYFLTLNGNSAFARLVFGPVRQVGYARIARHINPDPKDHAEIIARASGNLPISSLLNLGNCIVQTSTQSLLGPKTQSDKALAHFRELCGTGAAFSLYELFGKKHVDCENKIRANPDLMKVLERYTRPTV